MTDTSTPPLPHWPNVPACYGWLSLDARGRWRLKGDRVEHGGLFSFLNANYTSDESGNWLVNNGPQRVYVELESAPWVIRLLPGGVLQTHSGREARALAPVLVDEDGRVSLQTDLGPAAVDDRDLALFLAELEDAQGRSIDEGTLCALLEGASTIVLRWRGLPVRHARSGDIPGQLGFQRRPTDRA